MKGKVKCTVCKATDSSDWYDCVYCGKKLCDQCALQCDECKKFYCSNGKCGIEYVDEATHIYCYSCTR